MHCMRNMKILASETKPTRGPSCGIEFIAVTGLFSFDLA